MACLWASNHSFTCAILGASPHGFCTTLLHVRPDTRNPFLDLRALARALLLIRRRRRRRSISKGVKDIDISLGRSGREFFSSPFRSIMREADGDATNGHQKEGQPTIHLLFHPFPDPLSLTHSRSPNVDMKINFCRRGRDVKGMWMHF